MNKIDRFEELKQAIKDAFCGKQLSEDDLYGIERVLQERIDAELARPTDEDVERAIKFAEWMIGEAKERKKEPVAWYTILSALRAYRKPTAEEAADVDAAISELSKWTHYHHGFELDVAGYIPPDSDGVTAKTFETIATALRRMKGDI